MNKELWSEFLDKRRIAINCQTRKESEKFIELCDKEDLYLDKYYPILKNTRWHIYGVYTCYSFGLSFADTRYYIDNGYKIVTYKELMEGNSTNNTYEGWELAKALKEYKFKENTKFQDEKRQEYIIKTIPYSQDLSLYRIIDNKFIHEGFSAINRTFTLIEEPKKYYTLTEIKKAGKRFKYKDDDKYRSFEDILFLMRQFKYQINDLQKLLNEKVWEVED